VLTCGSSSSGPLREHEVLGVDVWFSSVTEELVRRRAEHNGGEISSLEELSLHQQDLQSIQHLQRWSRELRILYLQSNLIPRIGEACCSTPRCSRPRL